MLDNYTLCYHITTFNNMVLYSALTPAKQYLHFEKELKILDEHKNYPINCYFNLYDEKGELVVAAYEQAFYFSLKAIINTTPLKMLTEFLKEIKKADQQ